LHRTQLALVTDDGSVRVMEQGQPDTRRLTASELQVNRGSARLNARGAKEMELWRPGRSESWVTVQSISALRRGEVRCGCLPGDCRVVRETTYWSWTRPQPKCKC
jgi:hypothetical protein